MKYRSVQTGFSLIELVAVIGLLAILSGGVVLVFRGSYFKTQLTTAVDRIQILDEQTRIRCQKLNQNRTFIFDLDGQAIYRQKEVGDKGQVTVLKIPRGIELIELQTASDRMTSGQISITYRHDGTSASWRVLIGGPNSERNLLFCGRTGEVVDLTGERLAEGVFDAIQ